MRRSQLLHNLSQGLQNASRNEAVQCDSESSMRCEPSSLHSYGIGWLAEQEALRDHGPISFLKQKSPSLVGGWKDIDDHVKSHFSISSAM